MVTYKQLDEILEFKKIHNSRKRIWRCDCKNHNKILMTISIKAFKYHIKVYDNEMLLNVIYDHILEHSSLKELYYIITTLRTIGNNLLKMSEQEIFNNIEWMRAGLPQDD